MDFQSASLRAARPGERWVIRRRLPDGSATDLIGWLAGVTDEDVRLTGADAGDITVALANVIAARRAPAAAGGPDPLRTSAVELERHALPGWLADHQALGEWTLRAAGGFTGRANSCLAVGDPGVPIPEAAQTIMAWSVAHGIPARAQVVVASAEEAELKALGWRPAYETTDVLVTRLAEFLGQTLPESRVAVTEELTPEWERAYQESRPNHAEPVLVRTLLAGHPPRAFGAARDDGPNADAGGGSLRAIARGQVSGRWLGLGCIWTRPDSRRGGLATDVMRALGHWGARRGARNAYLQLAAENAAAGAAYRRLGFTYHHSYQFLAAPGPRATTSSMLGISSR